MLKLSPDSVSIGSLGTCIQVPSLSLAFDMGLAPASALHRSVVLLSHGHMDHISSVGHHIARRELLKLPPATYIMPPEMVEGFHALLAAYRKLDGSRLEVDLVTLRPGDSHPLNDRLFVRTFPTYHVIPSLGYAICSQRGKLKPQYHGLLGPDIRALRTAGVDVEDLVETVDVAFTGDTKVEALDADLVREAQLLIAEATFVDDRISVEKARRTFHTHLDEIAARADVLENEHIILTHFSARYSKTEIDKALDALPPDLRLRVTTLL